MPIVSLSEVQPKAIQWLWHGRIPFGAITLLDGDGGVRKSTLALNVAAMLSTGTKLPGNNGTVVGSTLLLGQEDSYAETVCPRLVAMGAKLDRIFFATDDDAYSLSDIETIEAEVKAKNVRLIIVDPLSEFLGSASNREQDVRRVLMRVAKMAARQSAAVLAIRHLTKIRAGAQQAGVGSVGIAAVARSGLIMAVDPAGSDEIVLAQYKSNLVEDAPSLRLRFDGVRMRVAGKSTLAANDLVRPTGYNERTALGEAVAFLREALSQGAVTHERIHKLASKAGVTHRTLRKAKDVLGARSRHSDEFHGPWYWHLPGNDRFAPDDTGPIVQDDPPAGGHLGAWEGTANPPAAPGAAPTASTSPLPSPATPATPASPNGTSDLSRFSFIEVD